MTIKDVFNAYEQEFSFEKQCEWKPYDFSSLRWGRSPGLYDFFKDIIMTDEVKKMLSNARLVLDFDFQKEMSFGVVKMYLRMDVKHPLATKAIRLGKATYVFSAFRVTRRKRPDGGWAWTTCKPYFDDNKADVTIEDWIGAYISTYKNAVLDNIEKMLQDLVIYDEMYACAESGQPSSFTVEQLNRVVKLVQDMSCNGNGIIADAVFTKEKIFYILEDAEKRKKVLDRLKAYEEFKTALKTELVEE